MTFSFTAETKNITANVTLYNGDVTELPITQTTSVNTSEFDFVLLKAESGYYFAQEPTVEITRGGFDTEFKKISETEYQFKVYDTLTRQSTLTFNAPTVQAQSFPIVTVEHNLLNCTIEPTDTRITLNGDVTLTVTADNGYEFSGDIPTLTISGIAHNFTKNSNVQCAINLNALGIESDVTAIVTATAQKQIVIPTFVDIAYNVTNGTKETDSATQIDNSIEKQYTIILRANENYIFNNAPIFSITHAGGNAQNFTLAFTETENVWRITTDTIQGRDVIAASVTGIAEPKPKAQENFGLLRVYALDNDDLLALSKIRFLKNVATDDYTDLAQYILDIFHFPITINKGDTVKLQLAYYTSDIDVENVATSEYRFMTKPIKVSGLYGNATDIANSEITLHIALHGLETIDSKYINTEIKIETIINILTNNCLFNVYSNDTLIATYSDSVADTMPYILKSSGGEINAQSQANINLNKNEMYAIVRQRAMIENTNYSGSAVKTIEQCAGYIRGNAIKELFIANATQQEIELIKSKITKGFYR